MRCSYHQNGKFSSVAQLCLTLCDPMDCSTPGLPVHHQLLEFTQTHVHWVGDAIQPSHPLLPPSIFPSIRGFSNESVLRIRWPKYWSFSLSISPSNEYSGLISFRMDIKQDKTKIEQQSNQPTSNSHHPTLLSSFPPVMLAYCGEGAYGRLNRTWSLLYAQVI